MDVDQIWASMASGQPRPANLQPHEERALITRAERAARSPSTDERMAGLKVAASIGGREVIPIVASFLADPEIEIRRHAFGLGVAWRYDGLPILRAAVADPDEQLALEAFRLLNVVCDKGATRAVRGLLRDPRPNVRVAAVRLLGDVAGTAVRPDVEPLLRDPYPAVQQAANVAWQKLLNKVPKATPSTWWDDPEPRFPAEAAPVAASGLAGGTSDPTAASGSRAAGEAAGPHEDGTGAAGEAAGAHESGTGAAGEAAGRHENGTGAAGEAAGRHESGTGAAGRAAGHNEHGIAAAGEAAGRHETLPAAPSRAPTKPIPADTTWRKAGVRHTDAAEGADVLLRQLARAADADRAALVAKLTETGEPALRIAFRGYRPGVDPELARGAAHAAILLDLTAWAGNLRKLLTDPDPAVRAVGAEAVGVVGRGPAVLSALASLLADKDDAVRAAAVRGMGTLCKSLARPDLVRQRLKAVDKDPSDVVKAARAEVLAALAP